VKLLVETVVLPARLGGSSNNVAGLPTQLAPSRNRDKCVTRNLSWVRRVSRCETSVARSAFADSCDGFRESMDKTGEV
jgi:hypothetical protein